MLLRAVAIWFALVAVAIANGAARNAWIMPRFGELAAHALSTVSLCAAIFVVSWLSIRWLRPAGPRAALRIGGLWLLLTVAFEFLAGHYLFGNPWSRLFADYNLLAGRVWVFVLATTLLAPLLAGRARRMWPARA
ncbi:MAG: hypothetical protein KIT09_17120 [Bryobacteraceae bacterium]|nr:hypothetical protein [Bryobacteraceae bacterium]